VCVSECVCVCVCVWRRVRLEGSEVSSDNLKVTFVETSVT